jgi:hypothetical protein
MAAAPPPRQAGRPAVQASRATQGAKAMGTGMAMRIGAGMIELALATAVLATAVLATAAPARAATRCPPTLDGHAHQRASVFDGPPQEQADLVPDSMGAAGDEWRVGYLFDLGRVPFLVCRYAGTPRTVTLRLQPPVATCITAHRPPETVCR